VELGYARVSTAKQDLDRQVDALQQAGIAPERIYLDKKSGATTDRPGLRAALEYARAGDVIVVHTLDRLGRTVRDTLNLIHELAERGVGVRNLADPIKVDSSNPADPMAQLAVVLLALFAQMERTYTLERAAHARSVATAKGRRIGRPVLVDADKLAYAAHLRDTGSTITEIVTKTGIPRTSLYRHLPPRPAPLLTAAAPQPRPDDPPATNPPKTERVTGARVPSARDELLKAVDWPDGYRPPCPSCTQPTRGLRDQWVRRAGVREPVVAAVRAQPCDCAVDEHAAALQAASPAAPTAETGTA
jgi:DNA invertase Pin-like site-specific DNA recombinase